MSDISPDLPEIIHLWPDYHPTPLIDLPGLARIADVGRVFVKVEAARPLGNFKVLGGMVAGMRALARHASVEFSDLLDSQSSQAPLPRLICASDGNHGLAVAAAAHRAGTRASVFLPVGISPTRARRIEACGGEIVWVRGTYDDAVCAAATASARGEGLLIADTSADPDDPVVRDVMAGYGLMAQELGSQFRDEILASPSHLFVQAGVGGLAAALADGLKAVMRAPGLIVVVEPESAACVTRALALGRPERIPGDLSTSAEMLSCGVASATALEILRRHNVHTVLVGELALHDAKDVLSRTGGPETTVSGAAGVAGLLRVAQDPHLRSLHELTKASHVLLVATEGPSQQT